MVNGRMTCVLHLNIEQDQMPQFDRMDRHHSSFP